MAASAIASMIFSFTAMACSDIQHDQHKIDLCNKDVSWFLRVPKEEKVVYQGVANFDESDTRSSSMLYPAPNVAGFVGAVLAHGLIIGSMKNGQKDKIQNAADKVLIPYQEVLNNYKHKELMQRGLEKMSAADRKRLVEFSEKTEGGWLMESAPIFSMTQDQSAIVLDNVVSIYSSATPSTAVYQKAVRVISQPKDEADLVSYWTANSGSKLKEESAGLFAESLEIVLNDAVNDADKSTNAYKTIRYLEGHTEKMERGQLISERCDRRIIKTLRGALMSIPAKQNTSTASSPQCGDTSISLNQE